MRYLIMAVIVSALWSNAQARTYYLPDYQSEFYSGSRSQTDNSGHHTSTPSCGDYGFYSAPQNNAECTRVNPPAPGLTCYSCTACSSDFTYDSSNCSGDYVTSGSSCGGKYNQCTCNRAQFPGSSSGGCPAGLKTDLSASCKAPSDTETYYKCTDDPCEGLADNKTDFGCQSYYKQCPSKCEVGKTCVVKSCSLYPMTTGTVSNPKFTYKISTCSPGCGDNSTFYKYSTCKTDNIDGIVQAVDRKCETVYLTKGVNLQGKTIDMKGSSLYVTDFLENGTLISSERTYSDNPLIEGADLTIKNITIKNGTTISLSAIRLSGSVYLSGIRMENLGISQFYRDSSIKIDSLGEDNIVLEDITGHGNLKVSISCSLYGKTYGSLSLNNMKFGENNVNLGEVVEYSQIVVMHNKNCERVEDDKKFKMNISNFEIYFAGRNNSIYGYETPALVIGSSDSYTKITIKGTNTIYLKKSMKLLQELFYVSGVLNMVGAELNIVNPYKAFSGSGKVMVDANSRINIYGATEYLNDPANLIFENGGEIMTSSGVYRSLMPMASPQTSFAFPEDKFEKVGEYSSWTD